MSTTATARAWWRRWPVITGVLLLVWLRIRWGYDDFPNPDMAGMAYNAEVLLDGGLPYRDTVEFKSPGTFFVHAACFGLFGHSLVAVQVIYAGWLVFGAWAVARAARLLYSSHAYGEIAISVAVGLYLWLAASFAPNYSAWMMPAYAAAFAGLLGALYCGGIGRHVGAGVWAAVAYLLKSQAVVLGLVFPLVFWWARRRGLTGARGLAWVAWLGGAVIAVTPLGMLYARADALGALVQGVFPWSIARDYAESTAGAGWALLWHVPVQLVTVFPVAAVMCLLAVFGRGRDPRTAPWFPPVVLLAASMLAAGLGGQRYYLHYLAQYVPAVALCAAHPAGLSLGADLVRRRGTTGWPTRLVGVALVAAMAYALFELGTGRGHRYEAMARRLTGGQTAAQAAGQHIRERTSPEETILAWGWTAWPTYYWAQRRACSRIYKPMGVVTTFNSNTAFTPGEPVVLRRGPGADELLADMRATPPRYIVYSPSYVTTFGATIDPLFTFNELRSLIRQHYVIEAQYGDLELLRRRDKP